MSTAEAMTLVLAFFRVVLMVSAPILAASLVAGVVVGILQTATQINEASISYLFKVIALGTILLVGPALSAEMVRYTKSSFSAVSEVVK